MMLILTFIFIFLFRKDFSMAVTCVLRKIQQVSSCEAIQLLLTEYEMAFT